ncbi:MAG: hypothetical protein ACR2P7_00325, partial [bacterium]
CLALLAAVRMQYLPAAFLIWLARSAVAERKWIVASIVGGVGVLLLVGLLETFTWGFPFQSYYANLVANIAADPHRDAPAFHFYLSRLLFATAGGLLIALYAFIRQPRRHLLLLVLCVVTLALHMHQTHQELRFVFAVLPMLLIVVGDQLSSWSSQCSPRWSAAFSMQTVSACAAAFLALIGANAIDDRWLHVAGSKERGEVRYWFGQSNLFDVYLQLARRDDVAGVVHLGDPYFNTPGYYYLHRSVPFYDANALKFAANKSGAKAVTELASHFVARKSGGGGLPALPGMTVLRDDGAYASGYVAGVDHVRQWKRYTPMTADAAVARFAYLKLGAKNPKPPPLFEFVTTPPTTQPSTHQSNAD